MKWELYIEQVLATQTAFDGLSLSNAGEAMSISPIVKASILMLEDELQGGSRHNVFVYPDTTGLVYEFLLAKTIFNITVGRIKYSYDPYQFKRGQKLKYKESVVVFEGCGINKEDGIERISVSFSNGDIRRLPIEIAPVFQLVDSKRVSTEKQFRKYFSTTRALQEAKEKTELNIKELLANHRTHLDGSIFFVSKLKDSREFILNCDIEGESVSHSLYIGQANLSGEVSNVFSGQMKGNPAIIIAPDLYAVAEAIQKGVAVQSIIINLTDSNILDSQLDVLDELSDMDFPIACVCDTNSSFDLDCLSAREYSIWRWNQTNINYRLVQSSSRKVFNSLKNCTTQVIEYVTVENDKLSGCIDLLNEYKNQISDMQNEAIDVHERLFSLSIGMLRSINPSDFEDRALDNLLQCIDTLDSAKRFISTQTYSDFHSIISTLDTCIRHRYSNPKFLKLKTIISSKQYRNICLVIPSRFDKQKTDNYWKNYMMKNHLPVVVTVMYPEEYILTDNNAEVTIISGWLGRKHMKNLLYSYRTEKVLVLEYNCEKRWGKSHRKTHQRILKNNTNSDVIRKYIRQELAIPQEPIDEEPIPAEPVVDELDEIELFIRENRYRQYRSSGSAESVMVTIPVSFIGGSVSFFGLNHSVISVTKIVNQESESIEIIKHPEELVIGDFIAIRESDRDIITDIADKMLANSGKSHLHKIARRWKDALELETVFSTEDEICQKIRDAGCTKGEITIRNWINHNEDYIAPKGKEDLEYIAAATEDSLLKDTIDEVYEASRTIKRAHQKAGMYLSQKVKTRITEELESLQRIDAFNVWNPIELDLDDIGTIKILKIIDVGEKVVVASSIANRLIEE